jgi:hypothetical protein
MVRRAVPVAIAISGDPVVGRALVLLLRGYYYDARFLPVSSLGEPGSLRGIQLLLITPMPELSTGRRQALSESLASQTRATKMPILKLVASAKEARGKEARAGPERLVSWPCRTEELKRRIEDALHVEYGPAGRRE